jgi:hypothetical protein
MSHLLVGTYLATQPAEGALARPSHSVNFGRREHCQPNESVVGIVMKLRAANSPRLVNRFLEKDKQNKPCW